MLLYDIVDLISVCIVLPVGTSLQLLKLSIFSQVDVQSLKLMYRKPERAVGMEYEGSMDKKLDLLVIFIQFSNTSYVQTKWQNFFILSVFISILSLNTVTKFGLIVLKGTWGVAVFILSCKMSCITFILRFVMMKLGLTIDYG